MDKFFYTLPYLFVLNNLVSTQKCDLTNVKTVLWKSYDTEKVCWSRNDELLLYARRVAQDLLPTKLPPSNLGQLLQYMDIVWEAAYKLTSNVTSSRDVIRPAIGDALGGYLQAVALPFATEAYYAGTIDYKTIKLFYELFEKIRIFLDTDGGGWAAACDLSQMATKVEPIDYSSFPTQPDPFSCQKLHIPINEQPPVVKNPDCPDDVTLNVQPALETKVEMPILDDVQFPRAIIVPFKSRQHLYSIASPNSADILVEYYDLSMKCIGKTDQKTVKSFNAAYFNWLSSYILPHIQQLKTCPIEVYPGFGGAMRVVDTISRNGLTPSSENRNYGLNRPPPKTDNDKLPAIIVEPPRTVSGSDSIKNWLPKIGPPRLPTIHRPTLPNVRLHYFLVPLLVPLLGCLLLYAFYLFYILCCLPLLACLCCRSRSTYKTDKQQPLLTLYYKCLESLNGFKSNRDEVPDYDSIAAASGVSARSLASTESEPKSCGMCQWIGTKEKTPETNTKKIVKKKKKKRKANSDSEASN